MRTKFISLLALMLCVSAFHLPMTAYAATQNDNRPTVNVIVEDETLRITASGGFLGIEAIFINDERFNFRVDGVLTVDLLAFRNSDEITIYAVDFAGTASNVATIRNPHYIGLMATPIQTEQPQGIPITSNPFTPDGQAGVTDNATSHDEKEFFTFTTPAGNVFFLVVDRQRATDNVYFLNAVTEQDLIALAEEGGQQLIVNDGGIPVSTAPQNPQEQEPEDYEAVETTATETESGGNGTMIFLLVAVGIAGGAGYYFKIVRPKQQGGNSDYEDEDEDDIGEEMQFEDEPSDESDDYDVDDDEPEFEDDGL